MLIIPRTAVFTDYKVKKFQDFHGPSNSDFQAPTLFSSTFMALMMMMMMMMNK